MTSKSKQKGYRAEVGIVKRWIAAGIKCHRVVLSGALKHLGDEFNGDVKATVCNHNLTIQSKYLANGWATIYRDIENHDCLIIKAKFKEALVVVPEALFLSLLGEPNEQVCSEANQAISDRASGASQEPDKPV